MFSFLKKCTQRVHEIPEPLTVRELALKVFLNIEGLDDIKEMMLRALEFSRKSPHIAGRTTHLCKIIIHATD